MNWNYENGFKGTSAATARQGNPKILLNPVFNTVTCYGWLQTGLIGHLQLVITINSSTIVRRIFCMTTAVLDKIFHVYGTQGFIQAITIIRH
jgi:hypothetical protein